MVKKDTMRALEEQLGRVHSELALVRELFATMRSGPGGVGVGELAALRERLERVLRQIREVVKLPKSGGRGRLKTTTVLEDSLGVSTGASMLAAIRLVFDSIEDHLAAALPHRSSGRRTHRFHGRKRMTAEDGGAIRADFHRLGREATLQKWCFSGERGYAGGQGEYTRVQVASTLAHDAGGHRRRRQAARA